jgi:hypothetical protein
MPPSLRALNPKHAAVTIAAAAIGEADRAPGPQLAAVVAFVVVGSIGALLPVAGSAVAGQDGLRSLDGRRARLTASCAAAMAVAFPLFGESALSRGIDGLLR